MQMHVCASLQVRSKRTADPGARLGRLPPLLPASQPRLSGRRQQLQPAGCAGHLRRGRPFSGLPLLQVRRAAECVLRVLCLCPF
jgi:hypothetical protein